MSVSPAKDETTPKSCAADNARSWPVGGMCSETTAPNRQALRFFRTRTASTSRVRVTLFRRPFLSSATDGQGRNARRMKGDTVRARSEKRSSDCGVLRDEPPKRLTGLPAPCLAAGPLRKSPSASPNSRPIRSGPNRTVAFERRAVRLQPPASLKADRRLAGCQNGPKPAPPVARSDP